MATLSKEMKDQLREKAKASLYFFAKGILGFDWLDKDIHLPLCKMLENYETNTRMKITLPRGWLKTTVCSCAYPLWRAINDPNIRVLLTQNTYTNACSKLKRIAGAVKKNQLFRALFPEVLPDSTCTWKGDSLCLLRPRDFDESTFEAAGARTQVTSRHYDLIIEDDTVAPELEDLNAEAIAPSADDIAKAIGWHKLMNPLLNDLMKSQNLVVGTRWAELDLLSYIEEKEPFYKSYELNAEDEDGNPRYPTRFPREVLNRLQASMGPYMYSCLYMNAPMRGSDMVFKPGWVHYYETEPRDLMVYTTIDVAGDPALIKKANPDYNVVITCGKHLYGEGIYVLDYWRRRANPGEVIDEVFRQVRKWHSIKVGVEAVAYQSTLLYWLREKMKEEDFHFLIEGITHGRKAKEARIQGLQPIMANGQLLMRPWMKELVNELLAFPLGAFDDIIDALSIQLVFWQLTKTRAQVRQEQQASDPLSLIHALNELNARSMPESGFPYDMMQVA